MPSASLRSTLSLAVLTGAALFAHVTAQGPAPGAVAMLTSQQDHDRQMKLLKISGFPAGPDAYQAATYDETTANPYPAPPDPLLMNDGARATPAAQGPERRLE